MYSSAFLFQFTCDPAGSICILCFHLEMANCLWSEMYWLNILTCSSVWHQLWANRSVYLWRDHSLILEGWQHGYFCKMTRKYKHRKITVIIAMMTIIWDQGVWSQLQLWGAGNRIFKALQRAICINTNEWWKS